MTTPTIPDNTIVVRNCNTCPFLDEDRSSCYFYGYGDSDCIHPFLEWSGKVQERPPGPDICPLHQGGVLVRLKEDS
ncbi:MAG: hypothetical protein ABH877_02740 [bacterium]